MSTMTIMNERRIRVMIDHKITVNKRLIEYDYAN
ncbi:hypothetical protein LCGC14_2932080, partial [marine sediment metagenome]